MLVKMSSHVDTMRSFAAMNSSYALGAAMCRELPAVTVRVVWLVEGAVRWERVSEKSGLKKRNSTFGPYEGTEVVLEGKRCRLSSLPGTCLGDI